ncbi:copper resistance system multicopper oxidase [Rhodanobacter sp. DHB23]|uniref:copper resistance system multicopper oxidase n=1 Tax=Rhodanobacter sp. DHB23 TaxID=2775923 RepID=UPI00178051F9|nr:copper resistance system multicopper oxidase [Rhodanobacter sp. DHB23]MBD8872530.1 copper resistance system multicopper oxidase [Rhodanobacter sp. DHB23]
MNTLDSRDVRLSRRRFVQGLMLGGVAAGLGMRAGASIAQATGAAPRELRGTQFDLSIAELPVDFTGRRRVATVVNGQLPAPLLRWRQGDTVTLRVTNRLRVPSSIHWHGILLPSGMDGVPGISYVGIAPGETFTYRFPVRQTGTYWYHGHSGFQEQTGLYGPIVVEPAGGERFPAERDYVVMLADWTDEDPLAIYAHLKKQSDYYNHAEPTAPDFLRDMRAQGLRQALAERRMWQQMRMSPNDLADVGGATYTYLMNGAAPAGNWTALFRRGEKVRLRFINGSAMTIFDVRIPGLKMTVVAADGQDVEPVSVDEFRIAVAETYDVIVEPADDRAWTVFAQSIDRSGYARGTLAPRAGMSAPVPAMDARVPLAMMDMMGAMGGFPLSPRERVPEEPAPDLIRGRERVRVEHDVAGSTEPSPPVPHPEGEGSYTRHARTEYRNPGVDMRVDTPRSNLDDPGTGLRDNGRRVLTYADLHTLGGSLDTREPSREIELHLTGNMRRYQWSFDGVKFSDARPVHFRAGERLRLVLVNDSMMNHPVHLHGMWSELESPDGQFQVRKHTVNVQPAQRIAYGVTADALGRWAYHCHMLYHMGAGMMREVVVS